VLSFSPGSCRAAAGAGRSGSGARLPVVIVVIAALVFGLVFGTDEKAHARNLASDRFQGRTVTDVSVVLEGAALPEAALALVEVEKGDQFSRETVRRSIKQLFALGTFSDIKVEARPDGEGVSLVFRLFPRVVVSDVRFEGLAGVLTDSSGVESSLRQEWNVRLGEPLEIEALESAAERMTEELRRRGFLWARVEPEASFQSPEAVVIFHVEPNLRARLSELTVEGVDERVASHVRRRVALRRGSRYSRAALELAIEGLESEWRSRGYYQAQVDYVESPDSSGSVAIGLRPRIGPKVEIEVEGADFDERRLSKLVPVFEERRFTEDLVEESRANLQDRLRERGYRDARVEVERVSLADGRRLKLRFIAEPGSRYRVRSLRFEGLVSIPEAEVREILLTTRSRFFRPTYFRQEVFEDDVKALRQFLERRGFHRARVTADEIEEPSTGATDEDDENDRERDRELDLLIRVDEGPRATITSVAIDGGAALSSDAVLDASGLGPGDVFDARRIAQGRDAIATHYQNAGFREVEVTTRTEIDEAGTSADVTFVVHEGQRTLVDRVILSGLVVTRESAARRLVSLVPGEPVSTIALLETRQKLVGSGLFRRVDIDVLPPDPDTDRSDVLITLQEGPRTGFAYGFGYEERQLARAEFEITRRNLFGLDRTVSIFTRGSFRGNRFIATYRQPDLFGWELPVFITAFAEEEDRSSFDYNRRGIGFQLSRRVGEDQTLLFRYRYDRTKIFEVQVDLNELDRRFRNVDLSTISAASVTDTRDDPITPKGGGFRILDVEWSAEQLGSRSPYLRGLAQQFFYVSLPRDMVAAIGLRLGVAQSYRSDRDALIPITERFFAGGSTTLRGFGLDEASPKEKREVTLDTGQTIVVDGEPIGGNVLSLLNLELRFPIFGNLRGVVFSDNGNVYRRLSVIELLNWRYNVGFGFRYETPLGPFRVDYGRKLDRRSRLSFDCPDIATPCLEPAGRWHISLGHAF
jgi:outer membrane protein assembly complex protein YaeT